MTARRRFTADFKAKVALDALRGFSLTCLHESVEYTTRVPLTPGVYLKSLKLMNLQSWHGYCIAYRRQASKVIEEANNKKS